MTQVDKRATLSALLGETLTDAVADVYLSLSADAILKKSFPFNPEIEEVPQEFAMLQIQLAQRYYLRKGAESETQHVENGVSRTYGSVDDKDLLSKITPIAKVV